MGSPNGDRHGNQGGANASEQGDTDRERGGEPHHGGRSHGARGRGEEGRRRYGELRRRQRLQGAGQLRHRRELVRGQERVQGQGRRGAVGGRLRQEGRQGRREAEEVGRPGSGGGRSPVPVPSVWCPTPFHTWVTGSAFAPCTSPACSTARRGRTGSRRSPRTS